MYLISGQPIIIIWGGHAKFFLGGGIPMNPAFFRQNVMNLLHDIYETLRQIGIKL